MSEFDRFAPDIVGEESEALVEQEASVRAADLSSQPNQPLLLKMKRISDSTLPDMSKRMAPDCSNVVVQEIHGASIEHRETSYLTRVWRSVSALWQHSPNHASVELTTPVLQDSSALHELLLHVQSILLLPPFAFSELETQKILKESRLMALQQGVFSLGLLLFLIDRQPQGFITCVEASHFSKHHLSVWVQQEGKKALYREIEESTTHDMYHVTNASDRMVKTVATLIMTRAGLCNIGLLESLPALLAPFSRSTDARLVESCELLEKRLQLLRNSSNLRQKLHHLTVPEPDTVGAACIRASWHLRSDLPLTCKDARKTLLATFLSHLRQQKGDEDCFAVALMISVMEESPQQVMEDLSSLLLHGALTRVVQGKTVAFPWIASWQEGKESNLSLQRGWRQVVASMSETPRQGRCTKRFIAAVMPLFHTLGAPDASSLACTVEALLKDSFRWFYEPTGPIQEGEQGSGVFALYKAEGEGWKKVTSSEDLFTALEEFTQEKWPDIEQRARKQSMLHAQLTTEGVALKLINRYRESFHIAPLAASSDPSKLHFTPWVTYTGGNADSVWHIYYEAQTTLPSQSALVARAPKTGEQLIALLVEWMRWQKKEHPLMQEPHRLIVRIKDVHAFALLSSPALLKLSNGVVSPEKWISKHLKDPLLALSDVPPSEEMREKLLSFVLKQLIASENSFFADLEINKLDRQLSLSALRGRLCEIALQESAGGVTLLREEVESKIDSQIIQLLSSKEKALLERHALLIGDSNWSDEEGRNRYIYLAMHPGSKELTLFVGGGDRGEHQPLSFMPLPSYLWLSRRWQLLEKMD